jgi:hypothetical protein
MAFDPEYGQPVDYGIYQTDKFYMVPPSTMRENETYLMRHRQELPPESVGHYAVQFLVTIDSVKEYTDGYLLEWDFADPAYDLSAIEKYRDSRVIGVEPEGLMLKQKDLRRFKFLPFFTKTEYAEVGYMLSSDPEFDNFLHQLSQPANITHT